MSERGACSCEIHLIRYFIIDGVKADLTNEVKVSRCGLVVDSLELGKRVIHVVSFGVSGSSKEKLDGQGTMLTCDHITIFCLVLDFSFPVEV